jgi:hypothetical protein
VAPKRLEGLRKKLNFFKAIGATRAELRHSDFLAFLFSPLESHGLGDRFLKLCLSASLLLANTGTALTPDEIENWDLTDTDVLREEDRIDLLLVNKRLGFGIIIENKTDTDEHSNQLQRYWEVFKSKNKSISKVLGIYLTPQGSIPSDPRYVPISYRLIYKEIDKVVASSSELGADLKVLLRHYRDVLESEFMEVPKESSLAWEIHKKFPRAIEFLINNDPYTQIHREVERLIVAGRPDIALADSHKSEISFILQEWTGSPLLYDSKLGGLLFWLRDFRRELVLSLGVNPAATKAHEALVSVARSNPNIFPPAGVGLLRDTWPTVWTKQILKSSDFAQLERDRPIEQVQQRWQIFRRNDLPKLRAPIAQLLR